MRRPEAYPNLIDFSKATFENFVMPDWMALLYGLPISTEDEDGNVTPITYTPKQAYDSRYSAGLRYIPYIDNGEGQPVTRLDTADAPTDEDGNPLVPTDYLAPITAGGGQIARAVDGLANAAGETMEACLLDTTQAKTLLETGIRPAPTD